MYSVDDNAMQDMASIDGNKPVIAESQTVSLNKPCDTEVFTIVYDGKIYEFNPYSESQCNELLLMIGKAGYQIL